MSKLPNPLDVAANTRVDHIALRDGALQWTYRELRDRVMQRAAFMASQGVVETSRVFLHRPFDMDWVVDFHAIGWLGACAVIPPRDFSSSQIQEALKISEAAFLVSSVDLAANTLPFGESLSDSEAVGVFQAVAWPMNAPRVGVFTSGTTGRNRLVILTTQTLFFSAMGSMIRMGHLPSDTWLLCLPLDHVGGIAVLLRCLWYATCVELSLPFSAPRVHARIETGDVHLVSLVPAMLHQLLDVKPGLPVQSKLRAALIGGSACPESLLQRARAAEIPVVMSWGMTEAGSQIATSFADDPHAHVWPLPFCQVTSHDGHLAVHGPGFQDELLTHDLGAVHDGHVIIQGRSDDVIISGGENISPSAIERVLEKHPGVSSVCVVGLDDACMGQVLLAALVAKPEFELSVNEVRSWCKAHLPATQVPKHFIVCLEFPMNRMGKIDRSALRQGIQHTVASHGIDECSGNSAAFESFKIDANMRDATDRSDDAILITHDGILKCDGFGSDLFDANLNTKSITHMRGSTVVGIGVDDRHAPPGSETGIGSSKDMSCELFEGGLAVFKKTTEKDNTCAVDVKQTRGKRMGKNHANSPVIFRGEHRDTET